MIDEVRAALARQLPRYDIRSVAALGAGLDNLVYEVNGELIVRVRKNADPAASAAAARREAALLGAVASVSTVRVPEPVFVDVETGFLAYRKLPGVVLLDHPVADPRRLAEPLAEFVSALHRAPVARMAALVSPDSDPLTVWRDDACADYREIAALVPAWARRRVEDFLARVPPDGPRTQVFCHNDLGTEHILVDVEAHAITGVIDWTDAAIADPMHDFARIYRDLGPEVFELMVARYEGNVGDRDRARALFYARCSLLEDVAFGVRSGARQYTDAGLTHLDWMFG